MLEPVSGLFHPIDAIIRLRLVCLCKADVQADVRDNNEELAVQHQPMV